MAATAVMMASATAPLLVIAPTPVSAWKTPSVGPTVNISRRHQQFSRRASASASPCPIVCSAPSPSPSTPAESSPFAKWGSQLSCMLAAGALVVTMGSVGVNDAEAASGGIRLPPLSNDPNRCERAFVGNTIGQANAVSDKVLDLRQCDYSNNKTDIVGKTLAGALMVDANFENTNLQEVVLTKAYAANANFKGADFTNAVVDRVSFEGSDMSNATFKNAVLSGATFDNVNLKGATFEEALLGTQDAQKLCRNPTLEQEARELIGCRN